MTLGEALRRENNNADLLRLIAACAVIWYHAFFLGHGAPNADPLGSLLGFDDSSTLAVKLFFFISGMLVTNSFIKNSSGFQFAAARISRIFPALIVCALVCIFIVGPMVTELPLREYFSQKQAFLAILARPFQPYALPGAFLNTPFAETNGAIWTIRYELQFYVLWLGLGLCGVFRARWLASALMVGFIVASIVDRNLISLIGLPVINDAADFPTIFALGALLAVNKDRVVIDGRLVCGLIVVAWVTRYSAYSKFSFDAAFLIGAIWLATTTTVRALRLPGDFSYGVYVFGWPIQKTVMWLIPTATVAANQLISIPVAIAIGAMSWFLVEKPCLAIGRAIPKLLSRATDRLTVLLQFRRNWPTTLPDTPRSRSSRSS